MSNKIAVVGDIHLSLSTETRENPWIDTLKKLRFVSEYCLLNQIPALILPGDIFDNLNKFIPASHVKSLAAILSTFKDVYFLMGNHDYHKSFNYTWEDEPTGYLVEQSKNMTHLTTLKLGRYTFLGRDWQRNFERLVMSDLCCPEDCDPETTVMVVHAYLLPESENVMNKFINISDLPHPAGNYVVGHYHKRLNVVSVGDVKALVPGSLTRIKSSETHAPALFVLDADSEDILGTALAVEIPVRPIEEVFADFSDKKQIKKINADISDFVKTLDRKITVMTREDFMSSFAEIVAQDFPENSIQLNAYAQHVLDDNGV